MASLDALPRISAHKPDASTTSSSPRAGGGTTGAATAEVSSKALYSVFAILGAFLVVSVVGAAVTFVETQAKESSKTRNLTSSSVEFIKFVNTSIPAALQRELKERAEDDGEDRNSTSFGVFLDAIKMAKSMSLSGSRR